MVTNVQIAGNSGCIQTSFCHDIVWDVPVQRRKCFAVNGVAERLTPPARLYIIPVRTLFADPHRGMIPMRPLTERHWISSGVLAS